MDRRDFLLSLAGVSLLGFTSTSVASIGYGLRPAGGLKAPSKNAVSVYWHPQAVVGGSKIAKIVTNPSRSRAYLIGGWVDGGAPLKLNIKSILTSSFENTSNRKFSIDSIDVDVVFNPQFGLVAFEEKNDIVKLVKVSDRLTPLNLSLHEETGWKFCSAGNVGYLLSAKADLFDVDYYIKSYDAKMSPISKFHFYYAGHGSFSWLRMMKFGSDRCLTYYLSLFDEPNPIVRISVQDQFGLGSGTPYIFEIGASPIDSGEGFFSVASYKASRIAFVSAYESGRLQGTILSGNLNPIAKLEAASLPFQAREVNATYLEDGRLVAFFTISDGVYYAMWSQDGKLLRKATLLMSGREVFIFDARVLSKTTAVLGLRLQGEDVALAYKLNLS